MSEKLMDIIARNDELAGKASPAAWTVDDRNQILNGLKTVLESWGSLKNPADAELIVSLRNDWPALSAALKRAVEVLKFYGEPVTDGGREARALLVEWGVEARE